MADEKKESIYCGTANQFHENGLSVRVCLDDIPEEHKKQWNGKTWVHLTVSKLLNPKERQTHSVRVDTYVPKNKQ
jgi:hypothetical protein